MKKNLFSLLLISCFYFLNGQTTRTAVANGDIDNASTWSPNGVPVGGDVLNIPSGRIVDVRNPTTIAPGTGGLRINITGQLRFPTNGADKLDMPCNSFIQLFSGGQIISTGGSNSDLISICNTTIWNSTTGPNPVNGPAYSQYPSYGFNPGVLAVHFSAFEVRNNSGQVLITWSTASENNNNFFEIQRSVPGGDWATIGRVNAGNNPASVQNYQFNDPVTSLNGTLLYRLKQVNLDNKFSFSPVKAISIGKKPQNVTIFPNPTSDQINILWHNNESSNVRVKVSLINLTGEIVWQAYFSSLTNFTQINSKQFAKGVYIVNIKPDNSSIASSTTILIQ